MLQPKQDPKHWAPPLEDVLKINFNGVLIKESIRMLGDLSYDTTTVMKWQLTLGTYIIYVMLCERKLTHVSPYVVHKSWVYLR